MDDYGFMMSDDELKEALNDYCSKRISQQKALNIALRFRQIANEQLQHVFAYSKPSQYPNRTFEYTDVDGNTVTLKLNPFAHQAETFVTNCKVQMGEPDAVYKVVDTNLETVTRSMFFPGEGQEPKPKKKGTNCKVCVSCGMRKVVRTRNTHIEDDDRFNATMCGPCWKVKHPERKAPSQLRSRGLMGPCENCGKTTRAAIGKTDPRRIEMGLCTTCFDTWLYRQSPLTIGGHDND